MAEKVGFIGLGIMGRPMARNLMKAGHELIVHTRTAEKQAELVQEGARGAGSPKEVAEQADFVITMLPDSPDVDRVVTGANGVLEGIRRGALVIDMSTISPSVTRQIAARLEEKGGSMLDAPVSGGDVGAIQGTLSIMVGGKASDFDRALPLFEAMGKKIVHMGDIGAGQITKAANQIVVAGVIAAVAEGLVLGSKGGVSPAKIIDVLSGGMAGNRVMEVKRDKFLTHKFTPGFRADLHHKDLGIALAAGREMGVVLPLTAMLDQFYIAMNRKGWGGEDDSAMMRLIEDLSEYQIENK
jgi:2-hydroxy-3-oxopropionate reductase